MNVTNERKHGSCEDIYYVIEGEALVTIGEAEQTLRAGDIILIPENTLHGVVNASGKPLIMLDVVSLSSRRSGR